MRLSRSPMMFIYRRYQDQKRGGARGAQFQTQDDYNN